MGVDVGVGLAAAGVVGDGAAVGAVALPSTAAHAAVAQIANRIAKPLRMA